MLSATHTKAFELDVPAVILFPLFSPEGEKLWAPGWDYKNIMGTTELSEDYVFLTRKHDHSAAEAVWIVKAYDPESHFVQYYKIEPGIKIGVVTVKCEALAPSKTKVRVTYKYIALSPAGEKFVTEFTENHYEQFINEWQKHLTNYFDQRS